MLSATTRQHRALIRISINRQRNGARIDHVVSVFWERLGGRNRLLAQTLAHKNFKLVLVCQPGRVISIDCEDNVPSSKLPSERPSSLERSRSALNSKHRSQASRNIFPFIRFIIFFFFARLRRYTFEFYCFRLYRVFR